MLENNLAAIYERVGYIMASFARIEAMKAENAYRRFRDESPAYTENDFEEQALNIDAASAYLRDFG